MDYTLTLAGKTFHPLGLGCWVFDNQLWSPEREEALLETMHTALELGINHFDTASGYGDGASEQCVGRFLSMPGRRNQVLLASKADVAETAQDMLKRVRRSIKRLNTEMIDLYYIHWPDANRDMRPTMSGLEQARKRGWIRAIGVSNFSPEQMQQVSQVGQIDVHQIGFNLFWRFRERDVIAYCREENIPVITYSSLAQGILTSKFPQQLNLPPGDIRRGIIFFQPAIWPHVFQAVEQLKALAEEEQRPLQHLAIRWTLAQPGIACALVGARSAEQVSQNAAAMHEDIPAWVFARMTTISDELMRHLPDMGDMYHTGI
jgi:myo-inositol catabolism protein IolS